jgi:succinoglycan biosynthesis transport protein ExoP
VGAGVAAVMGFLVAARLPEIYEAEARLLVGPLSGDRDTIRASGEQARTYAALATTAPVLQAAARRAGLTESPEKLRGKVDDVTASDVTRLLSIRIRDRNPVLAAAIANAIGEELLRRASAAGGLSPQTGRLQFVERASPPGESTRPSSALIITLAGLAGLLGAFGIAFVVDSLSTAVRSEEDLAAAAPVAVLGSVNGTRSPRVLDQPLVVKAKPDSAAAARYRLLAVKIELSNDGRPMRSLLVLEAQGGHSSGRLAANLAAALAEGGTRVVLLDSDERGDIMTLFGLGEGTNSSSSRLARRARPIRIGRMTLDRFRVRGTRLLIVRPRALSEPLELHQADETIEHLLTDADLVVLTASPVERSPNSLVWSRAAQATLLVAERNHTKREQMPAVLDSLRVAGANVIGTVLCRDRLL